MATRGRGSCLAWGLSVAAIRGMGLKTCDKYSSPAAGSCGVSGSTQNGGGGYSHHRQQQGSAQVRWMAVMPYGVQDP